MLTHTLRAKHALVPLMAVLISCSSSPSRETQVQQPRTAAVRAYLTEQVKSRLPAQHDPLDLRDGDFRSIPSGVLRGVVYHSVVYPLRRPTHAEIVVVVADLNGQMVPLENGADWAALARKAGWSRVRGNPVRACEELVQSVGLRRHPFLRPVLYESRESLDRGFTYGRDQIPAHVQPPQLSGSSRNRSVTAWFLESGRLARYECHLAPERTSLSLLATVPDLGLMRSGS